MHKAAGQSSYPRSFNKNPARRIVEGGLLCNHLSNKTDAANQARSAGKSRGNWLSNRGQRGKRLRVGSASNAAFREDGGNVASRRDIERRMRRRNIWSNAHALQVRDLGGAALLNGNVLAVGNGKIERRDLRPNVQRHIIFPD